MSSAPAATPRSRCLEHFGTVNTSLINSAAWDFDNFNQSTYQHVDAYEGRKVGNVWAVSLYHQVAAPATRLAALRLALQSQASDAVSHAFQLRRLPIQPPGVSDRHVGGSMRAP